VFLTPPGIVEPSLTEESVQPKRNRLPALLSCACRVKSSEIFPALWLRFDQLAAPLAAKLRMMNRSSASEWLSLLRSGLQGWCVLLMFSATTWDRLQAQQPGALDPSFDPGSGPNGSIHVMRVQSDHKILIGGEFTAFNGLPASRVARLNPDGSLDASFNPGLISGSSAGIPVSVNALAVERDGKVLLGGNFKTINGTERKTLARLNKDGSLDSSFDPGSGASMTGFGYGISFVVLQPDGKIVIAGDFASFNGKAVDHCTRLNNDGSLDPEFREAPPPGWLR